MRLYSQTRATLWLFSRPRCLDGEGPDTHQGTNVSFNLSHDCIKRCYVTSESMSWSRSSAIQNATCPPHTTGFRVARARAAGANGQPVRGRHAPRCSPADAGSAGRGRGLGELPRSAYTHAAAASRLWGPISYEPAVACRHPAVQSWRQQPAKSFEQLCGPVAALEHPQLRQTSKQ